MRRGRPQSHPSIAALGRCGLWSSCLSAALILGAAATARAEDPASGGAGSRASADPPGASSAIALLDEAYQRKAAGDRAGAAAKLAAAAAAGADPQIVSMELGYLAVAAGDAAEARRRFEQAARGPDAKLSRRARDELKYLPRHVSGDVYAEVYGWSRFAGAPQSPDAVPTLRLRALFRPFLSFDLDFYAFAQATRDIASTGAGGGGLPVIYADDYAILGGGVLVRFWRQRIGIFAQAGAAINLLDDGRSRVAFDGRVGAYLGWEAAGCAPPAVHGATSALVPCAEVYAEVVYASRFANNVIAFARPRAALTYAITGPVAWQAVVEARVAKDRNDDYYNNFADAGLGPRWRLLKPLRVDLMLGVHGGAFFGLAGRDPAPRPLTYADVRLQASTYVEF